MLLVGALPFALEQAYFVLTSGSRAELSCADWYAAPKPPRWVSLTGCQTARGPVFFGAPGTFTPPAGTRRYVALTPDGVEAPARIVWAYFPDPSRVGIRGLADGGLVYLLRVVSGDESKRRKEIASLLNVTDDFVVIRADWTPRPDLLGVYGLTVLLSALLLVLTRTRRA